MNIKNAILCIVASTLAACGPGPAADTAPASLDNVNRQAMRVLQFVPSDESEYLRQEVIFNGPADRSAAYIEGYDQELWYSGTYRLVKSTRVSGQLYAHDGQPLTGWVRFFGTHNGQTPSSTSLRGGETTTQASGGYALSLTPGDYVVDLIPFVPQHLHTPPARKPVRVESDGRLDFYLGQGIRYGGVVSDAAGNALAGVSVRLLAENGELSSESSVTAEDGSYRIAAGMDKSLTYALEFAPPASANLPRVTFAAPGALTSQTLSVRYLPATAVTITGTVLTPSGLPAPDVSVTVSVPPSSSMNAALRVETGESNSDGFATYRTRTDETGAFSLTVPRGSWKYSLRIQASLDAPYGGIWMRELDFDDLPAIYRLDTRKAVRGRVADFEDNGVRGAEVVLRKSIAFQEEQSVQRVRTDIDGWFETRVDPSVPAWDVTVIPAEGSPLARCHRTTVTLNGFEETFLLRKGLRTEGYVIDSTGRSVPRVAVTLVENQSDRMSRVLAEAPVLTDETGRFELSLPPDDALSCR